MTRQSVHRPRRHTATLLLVLFCAASANACSRAVQVQTPPTPVFAISVENATTDEVIVSYADGRATRALGTVLPGRTERFIIASPADTTVQITARSSQTGRVSGPYAVTLQPGATVPLTVR